MKFTKIENGIYKAENGMLIKRDIPHNMFTGKEMPHETRWHIFWRGSKIAFGITLREAKEWIEEHEAETHMLETENKAETQNQPETAPETESKEMNQPEPEKVTESSTEPQKAKSSHQVISRDQINAWNRLVNEIAGTKLWHRFSLQKEYKDGSRWVYLTHNASIRACYKEQTGERFFVKNTKALDSGKVNVWLYWENCAGTESERWLLNDLARDFFGC